MKIGILEAGQPPAEMTAAFPNYTAMFSALLDGHGFGFARYPLEEMKFPNSHLDADGWLISGSKHGAYEDHQWIPPLEELIRKIYAARQPLVGVCFGHQIIAKALGGHVEKFEGGWSVGPTDYNFQGEETPRRMIAWHQDQVVEKPKDAKVVAQTDFCKYAALTYGDAVMSVQPHPEFDPAFVEGLIEHRAKGVVPTPQIAAAEARLSLPLDNQKMAADFANLFLRAAQNA